MYIDKLGADAEGMKVENIRMFCLGKEFKDDLFLYSYDLIDEMTVQVMIKKWTQDEVGEAYSGWW